MKEEPFINPYIALFIAVLSVSTSAILVKLTSADASVIAMYRLLFTVLLMTPFLIKKEWHFFFKIKKQALILCTASGILLAFHFILWFESLNFTTVTSSVVLVTLQPLFAFAGTSLFFKEKRTLLSYFGGAVSILGSFVISWGDFKVSGLAFYGDILALLACAMITCYFLIGQHVRKSISVSMYTYIVYLAATITLIIFVLAGRHPLIPAKSIYWLYFLLLAIFPTLLGHSIFNWVIKWISTSVISMSILGEPIGATILAYFILHEVPTNTQWFGGGIILMGLFFFMKGEKRENNTQELLPKGKPL